MKRTLALSLLFLIAVPAAGAGAFAEGRFVRDHEIALPEFRDPAACARSAGRWANNKCLFEAADEVTVRRAAAAFRVEVSTIASGAHTCDFEGEGGFDERGELVAVGFSEDWAEGEAAWRPGRCEVRLSYPDTRHVTVRARGACQYFCGARGRLHLDRAERRPPGGEVGKT